MTTLRPWAGVSGWRPCWGIGGTHVDVEKGQDADLGVQFPAYGADFCLEHLQRVGDDVVVREHDALGQTRGALGRRISSQ